MRKEYTNNDVYIFLEEESKHTPALWKEFGKGILSHVSDPDFWNSLSEHLDCFRICEECGRPMIEGYVVDGCDTYCSKECLHKHITEDEFNAQYNNEDGNTYWTTWYEDSLSYNIDTNDAKGAFPNAAFYK